jgi:aspartate-semialdehyde dehydrogenase
MEFGPTQIAVCTYQAISGAGNGMAVTIGRIRPDALFDYRFVGLSHNTVRGAAGGAVLTAELLTKEGYITAK